MKTDNLWFINWRPEVQDKKELQERINALCRSLQLVMNVQVNWQIFMPPYIHMGGVK
jgi:hypothetical protein